MRSILCLFMVVMLFKNMAASLWDECPEKSFVTLCGGIARGKKVETIKTKSFLTEAMQEADDVLDQTVDVLTAKKALEKEVQKLLTGNPNILPGSWLKNTDDIDVYIQRLRFNLSPEQEAFLSIVLYVSFVDAVLAGGSAFFGEVMVSYLTQSQQNVMDFYVRDGRSYAFCLDRNVKESFLLHVLAMRQGKLFIPLHFDGEVRSIPEAFDMEDRKGWLERLENICSRLNVVDSFAAVLDAHHPNLQKIIVEQACHLIDETWEKEGVENMLAVYHIICRRRLKIFLTLEGNMLEKWVPKFLQYECDQVYGQLTAHVMESLLHSKEDIEQILLRWEMRCWERITEQLPRINTRVRQANVFSDVYKSWFGHKPDSCDKEHYRRMAIAAITSICDQIEETSALQKERLLAFAERPFKHPKGFLFVEQKTVGGFITPAIRKRSEVKKDADLAELIKVTVPILRMPMKSIIDDAPPLEQLLYLEATIKYLYGQVVCKANTLRQLSLSASYIQMIIDFYVREGEQHYARATDGASLMHDVCGDQEGLMPHPVPMMQDAFVPGVPVGYTPYPASMMQGAFVPGVPVGYTPYPASMMQGAFVANGAPTMYPPYPPSWVSCLDQEGYPMMRSGFGVYVAPEGYLTMMPDFDMRSGFPAGYR